MPTTDQTHVLSARPARSHLTATHQTQGHPSTGGPGKQRSAVPRSSALVGAAAALALVITGCSSAGTSSTSSPSAAASTSAAGSSSARSSAASGSAESSYPAGKEQVCQARDNLKTSLAALTNPALLTGGTAAIKTAVEQVQTDLTAVATAGKQDYQPQVSSFQAALTDLETAVTNLGDGGGSANLTAIGSAIAATGSASGALFTQLQTACTA